MSLLNVLPVASYIIYKVVDKTQWIILRQIFKSHEDDFIFLHGLNLLGDLLDMLLDFLFCFL